MGKCTVPLAIIARFIQTQGDNSRANDPGSAFDDPYRPNYERWGFPCPDVADTNRALRRAMRIKKLRLTLDCTKRITTGTDDSGSTPTDNTNSATIQFTFEGPSDEWKLRTDNEWKTVANPDDEKDDDIGGYGKLVMGYCLDATDAQAWFYFAAELHLFLSLPSYKIYEFDPNPADPGYPGSLHTYTPVSPELVLSTGAADDPSLISGFLSVDFKDGEDESYDVNYAAGSAGYATSDGSGVSVGGGDPPYSGGVLTVNSLSLEVLEFYDYGGTFDSDTGKLPGGG